MRAHTFLISFILLLGCLASSLHATEIVGLKTEYTETPMGIDVDKPRFCWQMQSDEQGACQTAYRILVTDETRQTVWDSGKVNSGTSLNIEYGGTSLQPTTRYTWQVTVWDSKKKPHTADSWFETGLMSSDGAYEGWSDARWIGGGDDDLVLYAHYLPVFQLDYTMQLGEASHSTRAGFVYGANDRRLMDKNKNLYQLANKKDESYVMLMLDISPLDSGKDALLHVYRVGYHPTDQKDVPLRSFVLPLITQVNAYARHIVSIRSEFGFSVISFDGEKIGEVNLNPLGQGGDFIAFPVVGDIGYYLPAEQAALITDIQIRNFRTPSQVLYTEKSGWLVAKGGEMMCVAALEGKSSPMLRTTFSPSSGKIVKARLYATARGIYDLYLNGERIGDDYFNPGLTQYNKTHLYQTFDVTRYIKEGQNTIGAVLAEGWWSGSATFQGGYWNFFGDRQSLLAKLVLTYEDGRQKALVTEPEHWQYYNQGPVRYGSFFQGEVYDATKEMPRWNTASFDASGWKPACEVPLAGCISTDGGGNMPRVDDYSAFRLTGQFGPTVKAIKELTAISMDEVRPGVYIYDMGQNMVGVPHIALTGMQPGQEITLRFAEVKYPDLPEYKDLTGMLMLENIRAAMAQELYTARGGEETIQPRFTYHGYRFIEITGIEKPLPLSAVKGTVLSSVTSLASHYETSQPKVNKLWENITWSTYGNFVSIPTDCPQRNERLGWSGDISVFSPTATYMTDAAQFLRRHMQAMRDVQREDGRFTDVAPLGGGFGEFLWGSAGITVAWESYQQYGDKALLAEHYDAMKAYMEYQLRQIDPATGVFGEEFRPGWGNLGDWLSPEYERSEKSLLWESYLIYNMGLMNKMATVLDKTADAQHFDQLAKERKAFFNRTYWNEAGKTVFRDKLIDTQVSYVLPLVFGIPEEAQRKKAVDNLLSVLRRENRADNGTVCPPYSLMTGFIGTAWISKALSEQGCSEDAYRLLLQTSYPSWLYPVEQGATTIWERLNSYTHVDGFGGNNSMNSFNHYSFGAVGYWMYAHSLGIKRDEQSPGFRHFVLEPETDPTGEITFAQGYYDSMYGRIKSRWEVKGGVYYYEFDIPANTSATLRLPAASAEQVRLGNNSLKSVKSVKYLGEKEGKQCFELPSGKYRMIVAGR